MSSEILVPGAAIDMSTQSSSNTVSAVSWGAIFAGAIAAAALSLVLFILGAGLGLAAVSPWSFAGVGATAFGISTILWITITQLCASGLGGYIAGRLRTRWPDAHEDEVFFRDTAHGFLSWGVASLLTAVLISGVVGAVTRTGVQAGATVASGVGGGVALSSMSGMDGMQGGMSPHIGRMGSERMDRSEGNDFWSYWVDALFRSDSATTPSPNTSGGGFGRGPDMALNAEMIRILRNAMTDAGVSQDDLRYVKQRVAQQTGITQQQADERVDRVYAQLQALKDEAKQAADKARKASMLAALWMFAALLVGAFTASWLATFGGRLRDRQNAVPVL